MPTEASAFCGFREQLYLRRELTCTVYCWRQLSLLLTGSKDNTDMAQCFIKCAGSACGSLKPPSPKLFAGLPYQNEPGPICVKHWRTHCTIPAHSIRCKSDKSSLLGGRTIFLHSRLYKKVSSTMWFSETYNHYATQTHRNASVFIIALAINIGI